MIAINKESIAEWFKSLQDNICTSIEAEDGKGVFQEDLWEREEGGGGRTRVITDGIVIEKGGVNFSAVHGPTPDNILKALNLSSADFFATGVSIVMHTRNPHVPIIHMNVRYFEMSDGTRWFGGGIDVTPHYVDQADAKSFHQTLKTVCDEHDSSYYDQFKKWADDYFYINHRKETRGIGGIFFDRLSPKDDAECAKLFSFVQDVGSSFASIYTTLMNKHKNTPYSEGEKAWQKVRRSRYAEFNLVYDKGTKFGLDTDGRIESILMSMPPEATWIYDYQPKNDREKETLSLLKKGINWVNV